MGEWGGAGKVRTLIAGVRWGAIAAVAAWAVAGGPTIRSAALGIVGAMVLYALAASLTLRLPASLTEPVVRLAYAGDLLAASLWLVVYGDRPAGVIGVAFVAIALEGLWSFGWRGGVAAGVTLVAADGLARWVGIDPGGMAALAPPAALVTVAVVVGAGAAMAAHLERARQTSGRLTDALTRERVRLQRELAENDVKREAVHAGEERLRALVRGAPVTLFTVDRDSLVTAIEGAGLARLERHQTDAVGWSVAELFPRAPTVAHGIRDALGGTASQGTAESDGQTFAMRYAPLRDTGGHVTGAIGVALDVTDRKDAERALDEQSQLAQALVDAQSDLLDLVLVSEGGQTTYVNEAAATVTGYDQSDLIGLPSLYALAPDAERAAVDARRANHRAGDVMRFEIAIRRKDGELVELEMAEVEVSTGAHVRVVAIGRDVTERKRAERDRQALVGRLLAAEEATRKKIAQDIHDDSIQTLFAALIRLHMLTSRITDPEALATLEQLSATIDRSIETLRHLLFDLRPVALDSEGLATALRLYLDEMKADTGIIGLVTDGCAAEPDADSRIMLYRIAQEALANVRKHARASHVDVSLVDRDGGVLLTIRDDGRGFSMADLPAIRPGHLGLQAMRERTEMAHGRFTIQSTPGSGTTVEAWIPGPASAERAA